MNIIELTAEWVTHNCHNVLYFQIGRYEYVLVQKSSTGVFTSGIMPADEEDFTDLKIVSTLSEEEYFQYSLVLDTIDINLLRSIQVYSINFLNNITVSPTERTINHGLHDVLIQY